MIGIIGDITLISTPFLSYFFVVLNVVRACVYACVCTHKRVYISTCVGACARNVRACVCVCAHVMCVRVCAHVMCVRACVCVCVRACE